MKLVSIIIFTVFTLVISGCGNSYMYYATVNSSNQPTHVKSAITEKNNPPRRAVPTNLNINVRGNTGWRLDAIAASPGNNYLALGFLDINTPLRNSNGKLEIYTNFGQVLKFTFKDSDLKGMIEQSTEANYPSEIFAFHPYKLGFKDKDTLIVRIQPQITSAGDSLPQDVLLNINLNSGKVEGTPEFLSRTAPRQMPVHPPNTNNNFEVINGEMHLNGIKLNGMPNNLHKSLHAETQL